MRTVTAEKMATGSDLLEKMHQLLLADERRLLRPEDDAPASAMDYIRRKLHQWEKQDSPNEDDRFEATEVTHFALSPSQGQELAALYKEDPEKANVLLENMFIEQMLAQNKKKSVQDPEKCSFNKKKTSRRANQVTYKTKTRRSLALRVFLAVRKLARAKRRKGQIKAKRRCRFTYRHHNNNKKCYSNF